MTAATDETVGARLDRLAWSRLHTTILLALGAGWLFDSFEVQMFSSAVGPLGDHFGASVLARDALLAVWLTGILLGAPAGGRLTDRFGRRKLFVITLLWYAGFTMATGLAPTLGFVYVFRFLAALGVGAEYAIVTAAIAEFAPARVRGRVNALVMNFWSAGAILAALLAYLLLDTLALGSAVSWRYMFILGGLIALIVLYFRRRIPESPRWLASRGRHQEAEAIVAGLEQRPGAADAADVRAGDAAPGLREAPGELAGPQQGRPAAVAAARPADAPGHDGPYAAQGNRVAHLVYALASRRSRAGRDNGRRPGFECAGHILPSYPPTRPAPGQACLATQATCVTFCAVARSLMEAVGAAAGARQARCAAVERFPCRKVRVPLPRPAAWRYASRPFGGTNDPEGCRNETGRNFFILAVDGNEKRCRMVGSPGTKCTGV